MRHGGSQIINCFSVLLAAQYTPRFARRVLFASNTLKTIYYPRHREPIVFLLYIYFGLESC